MKYLKLILIIFVFFRLSDSFSAGMEEETSGCTRCFRNKTPQHFKDAEKSLRLKNLISKELGGTTANFIDSMGLERFNIKTHWDIILEGLLENRERPLNQPQIIYEYGEKPGKLLIQIYESSSTSDKLYKKLDKLANHYNKIIQQYQQINRSLDHSFSSTSEVKNSESTIQVPHPQKEGSTGGRQWFKGLFSKKLPPNDLHTSNPSLQNGGSEFHLDLRRETDLSDHISLESDEEIMAQPLPISRPKQPDIAPQAPKVTHRSVFVGMETEV